MAASITLAGESLIAQKLAAREGLKVARFIFAYVSGLNSTGPVDRAAGKPSASSITYTHPIADDKAGYVNPNQVVYSAQIGSDVGDWSFNWIGLETVEGVLLAVAYVPLLRKYRNIPPLQIGNNLTRNFLVVFDGAQALTGVTIDAKTWQHDFTVRLAGIDERERQSNRDVFGQACFFSSSLQVEKVGSTYQVKPGTAYVEGIRVESAAAVAVVPPAFPTTAWLDVCLQRQLSDVMTSWQVVFGTGKTDYTDSAGVRHYCVPLADLTNAATLTDRRSVEGINGALVTYFAARNGDYADLRARATTKDDVDLGNLPNALSDDQETNSSVILATTKALKTATSLVWTGIANIISGTTVVGKAAKLATARKISLSGAVTGNVSFDASTDVTLVTTAAAATEGAGGVVKLASVAKAVEGLESSTAVTPAGLKAARMNRVARLSSAAVQLMLSGSQGAEVFSPLSYSFNADGGIYLIMVKLNTCADAMNLAGERYFAAKLKNGSVTLDSQAWNINQSRQGVNYALLWSGPLTGAVALTVTLEKDTTTGYAVINGDAHDSVTNQSGQISCLEIYRMGA